MRIGLTVPHYYAVARLPAWYDRRYDPFWFLWLAPCPADSVYPVSNEGRASILQGFFLNRFLYLNEKYGFVDGYTDNNSNNACHSFPSSTSITNDIESLKLLEIILWTTFTVRVDVHKLPNTARMKHMSLVCA